VWWDDPDEVLREWQDYVRAFPEGEDVLAATTLWLDYLGDGMRHAGLRHRSFVYAKRMLHFLVGGTRGSTFALGEYWHNRIREFGLKWHPENNEIEVIDKHRWRHALSILRQTGRLPYRTFLARLESGCHYDDPISKEDLPPLPKARHPGRRRVLWPAGAPYRRDERMNGYEEPRYQLPVEQPEQNAYNPVQRFIWRLTEDM